MLIPSQLTVVWALPWWFVAKETDLHYSPTCELRNHSVYGLSLWETTLLCNVVSHWLSPHIKWSLEYISGLILGFATSPWETALQSNSVSHWLGANLESALPIIFCTNQWDMSPGSQYWSFHPGTLLSMSSHCTCLKIGYLVVATSKICCYHHVGLTLHASQLQ